MIYIIYLVQVILVLTCLNSEMNFKNKFSLKFLIFGIFFVVFFLISGLRDIGIDQDSIGYLNYYNSPDILVLAEPTFFFISEIIRSTLNDFQYVLIFYAFLSIYLKFYAIYNYSSKIYFSLLIYFSNYYLLHDFTQIRVAVASGLFLVSIKYIAARQFAKFVFLISIAILFHYSSAILLPLYFLGSNFFIKERIKIFCFILLPIGFLLHFLSFDIISCIPDQYLNNKLIEYQKMLVGSEIKLNVFNIIYLSKYAIFYLILFNFHLIDGKIKYFRILLCSYAISLFMYVAFSINYVVSQRLSELVGIVEILLYTSLFYIFKERLINIFIFIAIGMSFFLINIYHVKLITS